MATEFRDRFFARHRWAITFGASVAAVVLAVVVYRVTAPKSAQRIGASGARLPMGDVLQVGALPVT